MGNKMIYLDEACENIIETIKKQDPNFNFSFFIREALLKFGGATMDESTILEKIQEAENTIKRGQDAIVIWKKKHEEFLISKALKEKVEKDTEAERLIDLEHREEMQRINDFLTGFNKEDPRWVEYQAGITEGKWNGVTEFARHKIK